MPTGPFENLISSTATATATQTAQTETDRGQIVFQVVRKSALGPSIKFLRLLPLATFISAMGEELTGQVVLVLVVGKDGDDSRCEGEDDAIQAANVSQNGPESVGRSLHEFGVACHFKLDQHSREK